MYTTTAATNKNISSLFLSVKFDYIHVVKTCLPRIRFQESKVNFRGWFRCLIIGSEEESFFHVFCHLFNQESFRWKHMMLHITVNLRQRKCPFISFQRMGPISTVFSFSFKKCLYEKSPFMDRKTDTIKKPCLTQTESQKFIH